MALVGQLYVDTNIFIHIFEHSDALSNALVGLFTTKAKAQPFLVTSELTLLELLVGAYRRADDRLIERYDAWTISNDFLDVGEIARPVLWCAAVLRSQYPSLKTPDAIHLSTAIGMRCTHVLSADRRLADRYELFHSRFGVAKGPATVAVIRPDVEVVRQLTEIAAG